MWIILIKTQQLRLLEQPDIGPVLIGRAIYQHNTGVRDIHQPGVADNELMPATPQIIEVSSGPFAVILNRPQLAAE